MLSKRKSLNCSAWYTSDHSIWTNMHECNSYVPTWFLLTMTLFQIHVRAMYKPYRSSIFILIKYDTNCQIRQIQRDKIHNVYSHLCEEATSRFNPGISAAKRGSSPGRRTSRPTILCWRPHPFLTFRYRLYVTQRTEIFCLISRPILTFEYGLYVTQRLQSNAVDYAYSSPSGMDPT